MNHQISESVAITMTSRFRSNNPGILKQEYQNAAILPQCETFDKLSVEALLAQSGTASLRIYYGMDENLKVHAILVAADSNGNDILPVTGSLQTAEEGVILDDAQRCPPYCPPPSPLNED